MTQISGLARNLLEAHVSHGHTDKPIDLIDEIDSIDTGYTRQIHMPHLNAIAFFHRRLDRDAKGEYFPSITAHVPLVGIFVEEDSINIGKHVLPEAKWEKYLQIIQGDGPVSDIISMGPAHNTPILAREINYGEKPHFTIKFDPDRRPWPAFRSQLIAAAHQAENARTP